VTFQRYDGKLSLPTYVVSANKATTWATWRAPHWGACPPNSGHLSVAIGATCWRAPIADALSTPNSRKHKQMYYCYMLIWFVLIVALCVGGLVVFFLCIDVIAAS